MKKFLLLGLIVIASCWVTKAQSQVTADAWNSLTTVNAGFQPMSQDEQPSIAIVPQILYFSTLVNEISEVERAKIIADDVFEDLTVSSNYPFEVSNDGTHFDISTTLPFGGQHTESYIYVRYAPREAGKDTCRIMIISSMISDTLLVYGNAIDECSVITTFPFSEDFSTFSMSRPCWDIVDANYDDTTLMYYDYLTPTEEILPAVGYWAAQESQADEWLISPEMTLEANMQASFDYITSGENGPETFAVFVIPAGMSHEFAENVLPAKNVEDTNWTHQLVDLSAYAGRTVKVAISVISQSQKDWIAFSNFEVRQQEVKIDEVQGSQISMYPNPANNVINVSAAVNMSSIEVYTIAGQKVADYTVSGTRAAINVNDLSNGMYIMQIVSENGVSAQKFNVAR